MAAPQFTDAEVDALVDGSLKRRGIDLKAIPTSEQHERMVNAIQGFKGRALDDAKRELTDAAKEMFRAVLGEEVWPKFEALSKEFRAADQKGPSLGVRTFEANKDELKRQTYHTLGAMAVQSWCRKERKDLPEMVRAQLGLTENKGGAAIQEGMAEGFAYVMQDHSVARQMLPPSRQIPLGEHLSVVWPTITARPAAAAGTENVAGSATDATLATKANSSATAAIIKGWIPFSKVIPPGQLAAMMATIGEMLGESIGYTEDLYFFNSSSPFTGMLQAATGKVANVTADGAATLEALQDINAHQFFAKMKRSIEPNHIGRGVFVFNPEVWGIIEGLTDSQNRPLYGTGNMGGLPLAQFPAPVSVPTPLQLLNRPVYLTSALPGVAAASGDRFCLYMDPSAAGMAFRLRDTEVNEDVEAKELNNVIIAWELWAHRLLLPTCAVAGILG